MVVLGGGQFLMSEVPLYVSAHLALWLVAVVFYGYIPWTGPPREMT